MEKHKW